MRGKIILIIRGFIQKEYPVDTIPDIVVDSLSPVEIERGISLFRSGYSNEINVKNAREVIARIVGTVNKILGERASGGGGGPKKLKY